MSTNVMAEEYRFLRGELDQNKRYVFERPLIIVGGALAATLAFPEKQQLSLLPIPLLAVLLFNLSITVNRLRSSARIVGYLQLVHEGRTKKRWIGWENALRAYRIWVSRAGGEQGTDSRRTVSYDSLAYYPTIFGFHVVIGALTSIVVVLHSRELETLLQGEGGFAEQLLVLLNLALVAAFCLWGTYRYSPRSVATALERGRSNWEAVYDRLDDRGAERQRS